MEYFCFAYMHLKLFHNRDFPAGVVVKNSPANAGDMGLSPGPGRSHLLQSPCTTTTEPAL